MFRYVAFNWSPAAPAQAALARRLDETMGRANGWGQALSIPGLRVYTTGQRRNVNGIYPLAGGQGVVLGRLHRNGGATSPRGDVEMSAFAAARIVDTGGQALIDDYWGRYVAILRTDRRGTFALRDPSGALPCYRIDIEGVAIAFSWLQDVIDFVPAPLDLAIDWDAVAARLTLGSLGGQATALRGVSQLLPGQSGSLNPGAAAPMSAWSAVALARHPVDEAPAAAAAQLRQVVTNCVRSWSSCYDALLLRLSGGVDSAILLGALATDPTARITCLNYHSPGSNSDERNFARLAAAKAGVPLIERQRDATFRLERLLSPSPMPTPEGYVGRLGADDNDAEVAAAHGLPAMFTGAGGDQLFFQLRCTWPAADYLAVHGIGAGFVLASLDAARLGRVSLLQSMWRAFADQRPRRRPSGGADPPGTLIEPDAVEGVREVARYTHPELARAAAELPIGKFHQVEALLHPFGYYDPYLRAEAPEIVNPLLSQPLIELCLALPTWSLTDGGQGRALARRAFAPDIPREIATRQSKGGLAEHIAAVLDGNLPLARSVLLDGQLVGRGLLDRRKVEAALTGRLSAQGGHVAEVHDCIAIEAWLRSVAAVHPRDA